MGGEGKNARCDVVYTEGYRHHDLPPPGLVANRTRPHRATVCTGSSTLTQLPGDPKVGGYFAAIVAGRSDLCVSVHVCVFAYVFEYMFV